MNITILSDLYEDGTHDPAVDHVAEGLKQGRHKVSKLLIRDDPRALMAGLARRKPDLVFHLINEFGDVDSGLIATAALLDALKVPYTGGGPGELYIRGNKSLAKKILVYEGLKCPDFAVFSRDASLETGGRQSLGSRGAVLRLAQALEDRPQRPVEPWRLRLTLGEGHAPVMLGERVGEVANVPLQVDCRDHRLLVAELMHETVAVFEFHQGLGPVGVGRPPVRAGRHPDGEGLGPVLVGVLLGVPAGEVHDEPPAEGPGAILVDVRLGHGAEPFHPVLAVV
jgi:hypothetical protein